MKNDRDWVHMNKSEKPQCNECLCLSQPAINKAPCRRDCKDRCCGCFYMERLVCSEYKTWPEIIIESTPTYGKSPLYYYWVKVVEKFGKPECITPHPNPLPQWARGSAEKKKTLVIIDDISGGRHVD